MDHMERTLLKNRLLALVAVAVLAFSAQADAGMSARMFVGEKLTYEANVSRSILRGISVADLSFTVIQAPNPQDLAIKAEAESKGTLLRLFRYSFLQQYESVVAAEPFRILRTAKHDVQKQRVRDSEALFDYGRGQVTYVESDPKDPMRPPRRIASDIGDRMHDMVTAIYAIRMEPLSVGARFEIPVSDSGLVYRVPVNITKREMQKSVLGRVMCFKIEPDIFGPGRLIEQKGRMAIWITDDARRVPVKAELDTSAGDIDIKLKTYSRGA
jgi:hypothetical protein